MMRFAALSLALASLACTSTNASSSGGSPGPSDLISTIAAEGFTVQVGQAVPFYVEDCEAMPTCYGSNATSPYVLWHLPLAPGATLPAGASTVEVPNTPDGMHPAWQLRADELVLYIGRTSPRAAYFSYAPYLFDRLNPSTSSRAVIFASLSDALNLTNIHTSGDTDPFEADTGIILTAHAAMNARAQSWLKLAGIAESAQNTLALPAADLQLGLGDEADSLLMLQRFALFDDPAAGRAYLDNLPVTLLRITPKQPPAADPMAVPPRAPRGSGTDENALGPALDALEASIRMAHAGETIQAVPILSASIVASSLDPNKCLQDYSNCLGEVSDTTYSAGPLAVIQGTGTLTLGNDPSDYFIAFGVNHQATSKATYSNVVVQNQAKQAGIAAFDSRSMPGTASSYLPAEPDADKLFAVKIARSCAGEMACIEIPTTFPGVGATENLLFVFRAYLEPGHSVSPAPAELLTERVLHLLPPAP